MTWRELAHRIHIRKILMVLVAIFVMWSWLTEKTAPVAQPSEPAIEYLWT